MQATVDEFGWSRSQGVDALLREQDRVAGGLGELFDAGGDVDGVTDQRELQLACAADGARAILYTIRSREREAARQRKDLLTFAQTAKRLGVRELTIREWVRTDRCPVIRDSARVRIPAQWVEELIAEGLDAGKTDNTER